MYGYDYSSSSAILGTPANPGGGSPISDEMVKISAQDPSAGYLRDKLIPGDSFISLATTAIPGGEVLETIFNIAKLLEELSGQFIRNQSADSESEDSPGSAILADGAIILINYFAGIGKRLSITQNEISLQDMDSGHSAGCTTENLYAASGAASMIIGDRLATYQPSLAGTWYSFIANALKTEGYSFPRLKFLINETDTVSDELIFKIVDSAGNVFASVTNGTHGKAIQIPTAALSGTPNGQQLFEYSLTEDTVAISRTGTTSGDNSGTRGFAFVADSSRQISKMRIGIAQLGGSNLRLGLYDASGNLLGKSARFSPVSGIVTVSLNTVVNMEGGSVYYMAYWTDDTTSNLRFFVLSGRSVSTAAPLMQRHDLNEMPANIASSLTNTPYRAWLMLSE